MFGKSRHPKSCRMQFIWAIIKHGSQFKVILTESYYLRLSNYLTHT